MTKAASENVILAKSNIYVGTPLRQLLRNFEKAPDQWAARVVIQMTGTLLRSAIGLGSFLGEGKIPMHGDFEAQRHWMELTINIPMKEWYFFDLQYWGLDYPPLTAFHLHLFGTIGSIIDISWFSLNDSRGIESDELKTFMRFSSLISEIVVYLQPLLSIVSRIGRLLDVSRMDQVFTFVLLSFAPPLILIDHGHFQYNSVMLGLFLLSLENLIRENFAIASVWFILAINFKQMALYFAPFIFVYILSRMYKKPPKSLFELVTKFNYLRCFLIGITVIGTQFSILLPFIWSAGDLQSAKDVLLQILIRVFPFQRGLFEDKVGNFWCVSNLVLKYKALFSLPELTKLALVVTLAALAPSCVLSFYKGVVRELTPQKRLLVLLYGFAATSWAFFLYSFQVHEKSVLIALLPSSLLYMGCSENDFAVVHWINNVATFSLYPLLKKDDQVLLYFITLIMFNWFVGGFNFSKNLVIPKSFIGKILILGSYFAMFTYHVIDGFFDPPVHYPDIWVLLNCCISCGGFILFWLWLHYKLYLV